MFLVAWWLEIRFSPIGTGLFVVSPRKPQRNRPSPRPSPVLSASAAPAATAGAERNTGRGGEDVDWGLGILGLRALRPRLSLSRPVGAGEGRDGTRCFIEKTPAKSALTPALSRVVGVHRSGGNCRRRLVRTGRGRLECHVLLRSRARRVSGVFSPAWDRAGQGGGKGLAGRQSPGTLRNGRGELRGVVVRVGRRRRDERRAGRRAGCVEGERGNAGRVGLHLQQAEEECGPKVRSCRWRRTRS